LGLLVCILRTKQMISKMCKVGEEVESLEMNEKVK